MSFLEEAWTSATEIIAAIERQPFVKELADGTLSADRFRYYMAQDALYLTDFGRMLALAASQASRAEEIEFWAFSAIQAIVAERQLHGQFITDFTAARKSPTCAAYTAHLADLGSRGSYSALVAGVLPCFWIYQHVGELLSRSAANLDGHPYGAWIKTYADPEFAAGAAKARAIVERAVSAAGADDRARAKEAFITSCRHEWMFWDAAWRLEDWPI